MYLLPRPRASWPVWALALFVAGGAVVTVGAACGAGVGAKYEGDVRFERCMALDWQADVDPDIRKRCWSEWSTFFTAGQTRDRIEYAERQAGLVASARVGEPVRAVPEPTNAFAPPPMMLKDTDAGTDAERAVEPCKDDCAAAKEACLEDCDRGKKCERACSLSFTRCIDRCR